MKNIMRKLSENVIPMADGRYIVVDEKGNGVVHNPKEEMREIKTKIENPEYESEKDFQRDAEKYLESMGYVRLCPAYINERHMAHAKGFFGHWFESQRNAFMPDILVLAWPPNKAPLLIELKVREKYQPGQKEAIALGLWKIARSKTDLINLLYEWEQGALVRQ